MNGLRHIFGSPGGDSVDVERGDTTTATSKRKRVDGDARSDPDHASRSDPGSGVEAGAPLLSKRLRVGDQPSSVCAVEGVNGDLIEPKLGVTCELSGKGTECDNTRSRCGGGATSHAEGDHVGSGDLQEEGEGYELPRNLKRKHVGHDAVDGHDDGLSASHSEGVLGDNSESHSTKPAAIPTNREPSGDGSDAGFDHDCDPSMEGWHYDPNYQDHELVEANRKALIWRRQDKKIFGGGGDPYIKSLHALFKAGEKALKPSAQDGEPFGVHPLHSNPLSGSIPPSSGVPGSDDRANHSYPPSGFHPRRFPFPPPVPPPPFEFVSRVPLPLRPGLGVQSDTVPLPRMPPQSRFPPPVRPPTTLPSNSVIPSVLLSGQRFHEPEGTLLPELPPRPPILFQLPVPSSLPVERPVFSVPIGPPPSSIPGLITFYPKGLPRRKVKQPPPPPLPVVSEPKLKASNEKEVLNSRGKKRNQDRYLSEANITSTMLRCFEQPSERETAKSISKHLDTVVKVIQVISTQYNDQEKPRSIPKEFWGLCRETDKVAGRNMRFMNNVADVRQKALVENSQHPIPSITFSSEFNVQVTLPSGVKKVWFGYAYNQPTELPRSVVGVTFGHEFNQPVILPPHIRKAQFGHMYNQLVDLPESLRDVHFGNNFNQLVTLPRGLKKVAFGNLFTKALGPLPPTLEEIGFKRWWNHDITLPDTVRVCAFGQRFDKVITLGPNVEKFQLGSIQPLPASLPLSLRVLSMCRKRRIDGLEELVPIGCQIVRR